MKAESILKWHYTKSISMATEICEELYEDLLHYCEVTETPLSEIDEIYPMVINKI